MYLTFNEYKNEYDGLMEETDFKKFEREARIHIDAYTFHRLRGKEYIDRDVKDCMFSLIEYLQGLIATDGREIESETVDTHSISYATPSKAVTGGDLKRYHIKNIIRTHLLHTGLLYRGVD